MGYVRTRQDLEVDFRVRFADGTPELIQVCADLADVGTQARELRALEDAAREEPDCARRVMVPERPAVALRASSGVVVQSVCEWLLTPMAAHSR